METLEIILDEKVYNLIPNNKQNMVDAYKLRISILDWMLTENNLQGWKFEVKCLPANVVGECDDKNKVIRINYVNLYFLPWDMIMYALKHEIAHALTPSDRNHGEDWQKACKKIGIPAIVTLNYTIAKVDDKHQITYSQLK